MANENIKESGSKKRGVEHNWYDTWLPTKKFIENKKCLDFGIWKGLLNARARKELNCDTIIGIEWDDQHRLDCKKINKNIKLYKSIEDLEHKIQVDVIFMHGVICLLGQNWTSTLEKLLQKVSSEILHIRHKEFTHNEHCSGVGREANSYNLNDYNFSPSKQELINFLEAHNYNNIYFNQKLLLFRRNENQHQ